MAYEFKATRRVEFSDTDMVGIVHYRHANAGQYVAAGTPIVTIVQMHPLRLRTAVPEREARNIRAGLPVRVTVEGAPGVHVGQVARMSPSFDEANRTLLVETEVSNTAGVLRPGAFARAEIVVSAGQRALIVPPSALATFADTSVIAAWLARKPAIAIESASPRLMIDYRS